MARSRTYTDEQLAYIKQHWRRYPTKLVAEQLGMTTRRVDAIAHYHGLVKNLNKSRKPLPVFIVKDGYYECYHDTKNRINSTLDPEPFFGNPSHIYQHFEPGMCYSSYDPERLQAKPRKNWLQRLVSWLLTGEA